MPSSDEFDAELDADDVSEEDADKLDDNTSFFLYFLGLACDEEEIDVDKAEVSDSVSLSESEEMRFFFEIGGDDENEGDISELSDVYDTVVE